MRLLFGIIVGAMLTIGGAWILDQRNIGSIDGRYVNWEKVERSWIYLRDSTRDQVRRITG